MRLSSCVIAIVLFKINGKLKHPMTAACSGGSPAPVATSLQPNDEVHETVGSSSSIGGPGSALGDPGREQSAGDCSEIRER